MPVLGWDLLHCRAHHQLDDLGQGRVEAVGVDDGHAPLEGQRLHVALDLADVVEEVEVPVRRAAAVSWARARKWERWASGSSTAMTSWTTKAPVNSAGSKKPGTRWAPSRMRSVFSSTARRISARAPTVTAAACSR